jgi:hypothetical protein
MSFKNTSFHTYPLGESQCVVAKDHPDMGVALKYLVPIDSEAV